MLSKLIIQLRRRTFLLATLLISGTVFLSCSRDEPDAHSVDKPLFRSLSADQTGIVFSNELQESEAFNIIEYLYYYNGAGVAIGDLNGDEWPDIFLTANEQKNRLFLNKGELKFEEITETAGVGGSGDWSTGVTMADVNGDGRLDIYVCNVGSYKEIKGQNELFINTGNDETGLPTFVESAEQYGLNFSGLSTQAAFLDYDRDGDLDLYLLNHSVHSTENYGRSELRLNRDELAGDRLYRNDGELFIDVSEKAGIYGSRIGYGLGVGTGDINNDGYPDIYVSNDFHENDYLYFNNGDGTFTESAAHSLNYTSTFSMGNDIADFNNDGRLDIFSLDMKPEEESILKSSVGADPYNIFDFKNKFGYHYQYPRNMVHLNRGTRNGHTYFSEIAQLIGVAATDWSWSVLVSDLDNDGWKDIFITNGIWRRPNDLDYLKFISNQEIQQAASDLELAGKMPEGKVSNYAFRNQGGWRFEKVSRAWGLDLKGCSTGAALGDLDLDGDLDLVVSNLNAPAAVYENRAVQQLSHHYLKLRLKGRAPNHFGVGARVLVKAGGQTSVQELFPTRGYLSASEPVLIFGLGENEIVEEIHIRWPDGSQSVEKAVAADQTILIKQSDREKNKEDETLERTNTPLLEAVADNAGIHFTHRENEYIDFYHERLQPHKLSTQGPKMAVGDVNGDERADVYICGAKGQEGTLFIQQKDGRFQPSESMTNQNADAEETAATFVDVDGDQDLDLYLVSGGGEYSGQVKALKDQLWLNDGSGHFSLSEGALPNFFANGSCVLPLDFDQDGDLDLFVGTRVWPGRYGLDPPSYLLENDGTGRFEDVSSQYLPRDGELGMVTDAALLEEGNEKKLIVVGEWMPVLLLTIGTEEWATATIPESEGWWNTVELADLNGDGKQDLVLGNLGFNSDLKASVEEPVSLYVKDFDNNLKTDPVLTYFRQGKEYVYSSKDELVAQLLSLKKDYNDYTSFANLTFSEIFKNENLASALVKKAVTFASSVALQSESGSFELKPMPLEVQISPVFSLLIHDIDSDTYPDVLAGGNISGVQPSLGMYSASLGTFLKGDGRGGFSVVPFQESGWLLRGEVRDIQLIESGQAPLILVARNNELLQVFRGADNMNEDRN